MSSPEQAAAMGMPFGKLCAWMVEDDRGKRMESFKFGEPTSQPANTHGGNTANVIEECHVVEVELK